MISAWLRLFRIVNLPTVPGDVFAGAAGCLVLSGNCTADSLKTVLFASAAAIFIYMFGLVDNDITGAKTDVGRPIPDGKVSLTAARIARGLCCCAALALGIVGGLPRPWWISVSALLVAIVVYNRTKNFMLMGVCRGLNAVCGIAAVIAAFGDVPLLALAVPILWTAYIAFVTWYSEGEESDPVKRGRVGFLIGATVYLQLIALIVFSLRDDRVIPLLIAGAVMLVFLRVLKRVFPKVSAS